MALTLRDRILLAWKFVVSFAKNDWQISDYPVRAKEQSFGSEPKTGRLKQPRFMAFILNWGLSGTGDTKQEALRDLEKNLDTAKEARRQKCEPMPRPGSSVPVEFASAERVKAHPELADDFVNRVFELDWAWISDESSLWDFHSNETNDALIAKVREVYGVDVSDISSAHLWEIFDRIAAKKPV